MANVWFSIGILCFFFASFFRILATWLGVLQYLDFVRCAAMYRVNFKLVCNQHRQVSLDHAIIQSVSTICRVSFSQHVSIDCFRYLAVTQPLNYSRRRRSKRLALLMILIVWTLALAITCPPILGWYVFWIFIISLPHT